MTTPSDDLTPLAAPASPAEALARLEANRAAYLTAPVWGPQRGALLAEREQLARIAYAPASPPTPGDEGTPGALAPAQRDERRAVLREEMLGLERGSPGWRSRFEEYERLLLEGEPDPEEVSPEPSPAEEAAPIDVDVTADDEHEAAAVVDAFALPEGLTWNAELLAAGHAVARDALGAEGGPVWADVVTTIRDAALSGPPPTSEACRAVLQGRWGGAYETRLAAARAVARRLPVAMLDFLDDSGLGDHPAVVARFADVAERLAERRS